MHSCDSELRLALPVSGGASGTDKHRVVDAAGVAEREPVFLPGERRNQWTGENRKNNTITSPPFAASFRLLVEKRAIAMKANASGNITALAQYEAPRTVPRVRACFQLGSSRNRSSNPAIA